MNRTIGRVFRLAVAFSALMAGAAPAADDSPEDVLKGRGLTKTKSKDKVFVIASEEALMQKIANLRPFMVTLDRIMGEWEAIVQNEYEWQYLTDYRIQIQNELMAVDGQLGNMPSRTPDQRNALAQARQYRATVAQELNLNAGEIEKRRKRLVGDKVKDKVQGDYKAAKEKFLEAAKDARPEREKVMKEYQALADDSSVQNALKAHNEATKTSYRLGPSADLKRAIAAVMDCEKRHSPETAPRPQKYKPREFKKKKTG